jgi:hypothetical protein
MEEVKKPPNLNSPDDPPRLERGASLLGEAEGSSRFGYQTTSNQSGEQLSHDLAAEVQYSVQMFDIHRLGELERAQSEQRHRVDALDLFDRNQRFHGVEKALAQEDGAVPGIAGERSPETTDSIRRKG